MILNCILYLIAFLHYGLPKCRDVRSPLGFCRSVKYSSFLTKVGKRPDQKKDAKSNSWQSIGRGQPSPVNLSKIVRQIWNTQCSLVYSSHHSPVTGLKEGNSRLSEFSAALCVARSRLSTSPGSRWLRVTFVADVQSVTSFNGGVKIPLLSPNQFVSLFKCAARFMTLF